ncbi:hypothetical protein [Lysinibacillus agricola]|uniref:hypothetical protein n=1 Tax=Lysinibacillus agricola TaxID=2590012 RepID=UPI003C17A8CF
MNIKGIIRVLKESGEGYFYTTEKMLADNILVEEVNVDGENGELRTELNLYYYDDLDAKSFQLRSDDLPAPMMVYVMVKEIVTLHETSSLGEFLEIIKELSVGSMALSYQSKEESKVQMREWIDSYFKECERVIATQ